MDRGNDRSFLEDVRRGNKHLTQNGLGRHIGSKNPARRLHRSAQVQLQYLMTKTIAKFTALAVLMVANSPQGTEAQGQEVACRTCEVQLVRVQGIPSAISSTVIRQNPSIVASKGSYALAPTYGGSVAVFRDGRFVTIGRIGGGPSEFPGELPTTMNSDAEGAVYIVHGRRVSIVDVRNAKVSTAFTLPYAPISLTPLDGELLTTSFGSKSVEAFDLVGRYAWKHDAPMGLKANDALLLTASGDTAFWVTSLYSYEAHLMRRDGSVIASVRRNPDWFKSDGMVPGEPLHVKPAPRIAGVIELPDGLLLFVVNVPDRDWKPGPPQGLPLARMRPDDYYDTILEIVNIKDSRLIARARYGQSIHLVRGSKQVWLTKESSDGDESFEVFQPRLSR